jgi:hypothetical protein
MPTNFTLIDIEFHDIVFHFSSIKISQIETVIEIYSNVHVVTSHGGLKIVGRNFKPTHKKYWRENY